ncbi:hypothetical protein HG537_0G00790 [Torulaspora globosa]|uniref:CAF1B/HIR1 beta-propeller domain-containing protein n=1 Tax=Torulaspora globosa TaxID=48254 RepID=A0A7H9HZ15_9SACH|nr:hypothetical protein HG537_0G00790 [Torulaspora sp. CBS 2947]
MEASNLQIYWHESQPIYSLCFQPSEDAKPKLVTAGGDNRIRVWHLNFDGESKSKIDTIDYLSSLNQHEQAVNVVRFNHSGDILASAGDDGQLLLWRLNGTKIKEFGVDEAEFEEFNETWSVWKRLRSSGGGGAYEIYDIAWSPQDEYIVTGSMDNSIRIFHVNSGECIAHLTDHNHYVQGVFWDPLDQYIISQSADRAVHVYEIIRNQGQDEKLQIKLKNKIMKCELPQWQKDTNCLDLTKTKLSFLFHNETLPSFFRRPAISSCGSLFCIPAGIMKSDAGPETATASDSNNAVYLYTRASIRSGSNKPSMCLPFLKKPAIAVSFHPCLYELSPNSNSYLKLPYKLVFAVATSNEVLIYDTENVKPLAVVGNLHYTPLTDLAWSPDGNLLMISSTDGFCSYISFHADTLGKRISVEDRSRLLATLQPSETLQKPKGPLTSATKPSSADIVNILPIRRKESTQDKPMNESDGTNTQQEKGKRRVQPILIT